MPDLLPGYSWARFADANKTRYRNTATGQFVSRTTVHELLEAQVSGAERRLINLTRALFDGNISASTYQVSMRDELLRTHLQYASLGIGGWDRMTSAEYGRIGGLIWGDYQRLTDLARGIQEGTVSLLQAQERVRGYVGNARINYFEAEKTALRNRQLPAGMTTITIRDLGAARHCGDCLDYHAAGWSYDLPSPGTLCECTTHCRCGQRYRDVAVDELDRWIGTRR